MKKTIIGAILLCAVSFTYPAFVFAVPNLDATTNQVTQERTGFIWTLRDFFFGKKKSNTTTTTLIPSSATSVVTSPTKPPVKTNATLDANTNTTRNILRSEVIKAKTPTNASRPINVPIKTTTPASTPTNSPAGEMVRKTKEPTLSVTCYADKVNPKVGESISWKYNISGGAAPYKYIWFGSDGIVSDANGNAVSVYQTSGGKSAFLNVKTPGQTVTAGCYGVNVLPSHPAVSSVVKTEINPVIAITYPNDREVINYGSKLPVKWSYSGFGGYASILVDVYLVSQGSGESWQIAKNIVYYDNTSVVLSLDKMKTTASGTVVPTKFIPGNYKIKVVCQKDNPAGFRDCLGESTGSFSIANPTYTPVPTPSSTPSGIVN